MNATSSKWRARPAPAAWPWSVTLLCLTGLSASNTAHASPLFDLAGDMGSTGGLQAGTVVGGSGAAYFNPALLVDAPSGLTFGVVLMSEQIGISLDGRPGTQFAVPEGLENAGFADGTRWPNYPIATQLLQHGREKTETQSALMARPRQAGSTGHQTHSYELIGLVTKLLNDRLALGFHGMIPNGAFTNLSAFYNDEREQYFSNSLHPELYDDRLTALSIALGAGFKVSDQLSLGVGTTLSLQAIVGAPAYVADAGKLQDILIDTHAQVKMSLSPHFGVSYVPTPRLRLTATLHAPEKVELSTNFTFLLANGVQQASGITFVHDYTPWQVGAGAAFDVIKDSFQTLTLASTLTLATWEGYRDRHGAAPTPAYAWSDTLSPMLGLHDQMDTLGMFLDLGFQPTPVPAQTGRTNYVDNDRASASLGADWKFSLFDTAMRVGAQLQTHWLLPRHQAKLPTPTSPDGKNHTPELVTDEVPDGSQISGDKVAGISGLQTNNAGWPGFGSSGVVLGAGIYLSIAQ